jgi:hypothetical protein
MLGRNPRALVALIAITAVLTASAVIGWHWYRAAGATPGQSGPSAVEPAARPEPEIALDAEQREYIWQIEHHVLVLAKHWFHDFAAAWANADAATLGNMLAADFRGGLLERPDCEKLTTAFARVSRLKDSGAPATAVGRDGFVTYLLEQRSGFSSPPQAKMFAKTLLPDARDRLDGGWHGVAVARLWGEMNAGKPGEVVVHFEFRLPRPACRSQPGWLRQARVLQSQTSAADGFLLRDVTRARGIDPGIFHDNWKDTRKVSNPGGVYVCDFNRDGLLDMLVVDWHSAHLYQGQQDGSFKDVTVQMEVPTVPPPEDHPTFAAFADLDGDGWEDLILWGSLYANQQGRSFRYCTHLSNLRLAPEATGVVVGDFDRDGKLDLYVTRPGMEKSGSYLDGTSGKNSGNQLWRNLGNWQFQDVTERSKTGGGGRSVFSAAWFDANDDGWPDLYVPNEFGHGVLLVNQGNGTFRERTIGTLPGDYGSMGIACADINNDGKTDLYLANMYSKTGARIIGNLKPGTYAPDVMAQICRFVAGSQLYLNQGGLRFQPVAEPWQMNDVGWAYGPALADLDNDGFLDIFATSGFMSFDRSEPDG